MLLTVFVMDIFWQRGMVRSFADSAETMTSILLQDKELASNLAATQNDEQAQHPVLLQTGAFGGGLLMGQEDVHYFGLTAGYEHELQQVLLQSLTSKKMYRILFGFSWNILVPAKKYLVVAQPISEYSSIDGAIALIYPLEPVYASMRKSQRMVLGYLLINLIVLTVIGLYRFRRFTVRPIEELVRLTDAYEEEGAVPLLALEQGNELGQLSFALNHMLQRIEQDRERLQQSVASLETANREMVSTREEMVRAEKLASVGRLAAGLAHEIGNPLSVVQGYLGLLQQDDLTSIERKDFAHRSENELQRINRLIRQLLDFSRAGNGQREDISIHNLLQQVVDMVTCQPFMDGVHISTDFMAAVDLVRGRADQLQQIFLNCLLNAADAIASGSGNINTIDIRTILDNDGTMSDKQDVIQVSITDTGVGIAEKDRVNIFDPFFTTKEPGKGTGLGLSVAYSIVESCKGSMRAESILGEGTTVFVELPLVLKAAD